MCDQYETDEKADRYDLFKCNTFLERIEYPSIRRLFDNNLKGKRVVDLACGGGASTKILADLEPEELVGVDFSQCMIRKAMKNCSSNPKYSKILYLVKNCKEPINLGKFDVVFSSYLLNYAESKEDLYKIYKVMFDSTVEGGMCCGITMNMILDRNELIYPDRYKKYGLEYYSIDDIRLKIRLFFNKEHLIDLTNWIWPVEVHEECIKKLGFKHFEWIQPHLEETFENHEGIYSTFIKYSPFILFKIFK